MRLFLLFPLVVFVYCEALSIPMDIDLDNIREGTVTKPDGTKVTTTIKKEGDTTVINVAETGTDGSQRVKTIRRRLGSSSGDSGIELPNPIQRVQITSDHNPTQEELTELNEEHKPGTTTKPDGTKVTTTVEKKGENTVTTIVEIKKDGTETTKVITVKPDGSRQMDTKIKGARVKGDPEMMKFTIDPETAAAIIKDARPGTVTKPDGTVIKTTVTEENGMTVTTIETTRPDGSIHKKVVKKICETRNT
ncbi:hypothetical protein QR680_013697 [Steinernema hermaphroditum]|uniref:Uncharacterized protein n=1 Tax=Steinernema hermaphroditum TaxID=289476 RepID=A0AA39I8G9_9BILA|nr:hypothetical protein QR680_013697 [Steinernema hermaphroditum]